MSCGTVTSINLFLFERILDKQLEHLGGRREEEEKQKTKLKSQN